MEIRGCSKQVVLLVTGIGESKIGKRNKVVTGKTRRGKKKGHITNTFG